MTTAVANNGTVFQSRSVAQIHPLDKAARAANSIVACAKSVMDKAYQEIETISDQLDDFGVVPKHLLTDHVATGNRLVDSWHDKNQTLQGVIHSAQRDVLRLRLLGSQDKAAKSWAAHCDAVLRHLRAELKLARYQKAATAEIRQKIQQTVNDAEEAAQACTTAKVDSREMLEAGRERRAALSKMQKSLRQHQLVDPTKMPRATASPPAPRIGTLARCRAEKEEKAAALTGRKPLQSVAKQGKPVAGSSNKAAYTTTASTKTASAKSPSRPVRNAANKRKRALEDDNLLALKRKAHHEPTVRGSRFTEPAKYTEISRSVDKAGTVRIMKAIVPKAVRTPVLAAPAAPMVSAIKSSAAIEPAANSAVSGTAASSVLVFASAPVSASVSVSAAPTPVPASTQAASAEPATKEPAQAKRKRGSVTDLDGFVAYNEKTASAAKRPRKSLKASAPPHAVATATMSSDSKVRTSVDDSDAIVASSIAGVNPSSAPSLPRVEATAMSPSGASGPVPSSGSGSGSASGSAATVGSGVPSAGPPKPAAAVCARKKLSLSEYTIKRKSAMPDETT